MNGYLLDTNVLSELLRKRPCLQVLERIRRVPALTTSSICVLELPLWSPPAGRGGTHSELPCRTSPNCLSNVPPLPGMGGWEMGEGARG